MNSRCLILPANFFIAVLCCASFCAAQNKSPSPSPSPTPPTGESPDKVKIFTEEVVIPVSAYDDSGHLSVALEPQAIMVFEDDVRQTVRSIRRVPANVLLLLDTGGAPIQASIFRALQQAFPDSVFMPEQSSVPTMGVTIPFADPKNDVPAVARTRGATWRRSPFRNRGRATTATRDCSRSGSRLTRWGSRTSSTPISGSPSHGSTRSRTSSRRSTTTCSSFPGSSSCWPMTRARARRSWQDC